MEIAKTVVVLLTVGFILTFLSGFITQIGGGVGIAGGSVNKPIICAKNRILYVSELVRCQCPATLKSHPYRMAFFT